MRLPALSPAGASVVLALLDAAWAHAPTSPADWLRGYCMRAAGEPAAEGLTEREAAVLAKRGGRVDPRAEPDGPPMSGVAVGRVEVVRQRQP